VCVCKLYYSCFLIWKIMKTIVNNIELSSAFNRINNSFAFDLCVYCVIGLLCNKLAWHLELLANCLTPGTVTHKSQLANCCFELKTWNRGWNRVFARFHPILTILPDFNSILSIFEFYERFSTFSLYWLVKSYDFTSWIAILTTLASSMFLFRLRWLGFEN